MTGASHIDSHIRRSGDDYRDAFLTLLPQGQAWPKHAPESTLWQVCDGLNQYWGYVDARAADLLERESDPRQTIELLPDWERNWGLPDPCYNAPLTIHDRQLALVLRMTMLGGQSREFFIGVAAFLGYTITISEYAPFMAGVSHVGDTRTPPLDPKPLIGDYRWYIGPQEMRFYWTVHITGARLTWFRCGGGGGQAGVDHHLEIGLAKDLECLLDRWKPAHTQIVFDYSNIGSGTDPMAGTP
jgi:uncharacterized protein YmfQ (DUF2313 family)